MKYCISGRQNINNLKEVDEIKFPYADLDKLWDIISSPIKNKTFILDIPSTVDVEWELIKGFSEKLNIIVCIYNREHMFAARAQELPFYWGYRVITFAELRLIASWNPCYVHIGSPLCYSLDKVRNITQIPLRMTANAANLYGLPNESGLYGEWMRPEDVPIYEKYIAAIEFQFSALDQEFTLFKIYKSQKWKDELLYIIPKLQFNVYSNAIPTRLAEIRLTCGQRCMIDDSCHCCEHMFKIAERLNKDTN